jgi:hypothetical protein
MTPRKLFPWRGVIDPAEIVIAGLQLLIKEYQAKMFQRQISRNHIFTLQKQSWGILDFILDFRGVNDPAETDFGDFRIDSLGE